MSNLPTTDDDVTPVMPALGPGDDDPRARPRGEAQAGRTPLGPGDDDGIDRGRVRPGRTPSGPGDGPEATHVMVAAPPAEPGGQPSSARAVTMIPIARPRGRAKTDGAGAGEGE